MLSGKIDDIQAMLHLNPYTLMVNGTEKESYYIVAVATRKEYRGRRYMAGLLREALLDMYQAGVTFTYLMPATELFICHMISGRCMNRILNIMLRRRNWRKVLLYRRLKTKNCDEISAWAQERTGEEIPGLR